MACTITQADLGPQFAAVDPDIAALFIETATGVVLGPETVQAANESRYLGCNVDPCLLIKLLAQHLLATTPSASGGGGEGLAVVSERVGDVAVTYANTTSASGMYGSSSYGRLYQSLLARFERCQNTRNTFPLGVGPSSAQF